MGAPHFASHSVSAGLEGSCGSGIAGSSSTQLPAGALPSRWSGGQSFLLTNQFQQLLGSERRRRGILASEKTAVYNGMWFPVADLLKGGSESHQLILDKERHDVC